MLPYKFRSFFGGQPICGTQHLSIQTCPSAFTSTSSVIEPLMSGAFAFLSGCGWRWVDVASHLVDGFICFDAGRFGCLRTFLRGHGQNEAQKNQNKSRQYPRFRDEIRGRSLASTRKVPRNCRNIAIAPTMPTVDRPDVDPQIIVTQQSDILADAERRSMKSRWGNFSDASARLKPFIRTDAYGPAEPGPFQSKFGSNLVALGFSGAVITSASVRKTYGHGVFQLAL